MSSIADQMATYAPIRKAVAIIREEMRKIDLLRDREMLSVKSDTSLRIAADLDMIVAGVSRVCANLRLNLEEIRVALPTDQASQNLYQLNVRQARQVVNGYCQTLHNFRRVLKDKAARQLRVIDPTLDDERIDALVATRQVREIFANLHLADHPSHELDQTVTEIQEQYSGMLKLERTVQEIQDLFQAFAFLMSTQQETMDQVETRIEVTAQTVTETTDSLKQSERTGNKSRRRSCCALFGVLSILGVGLTPIWIRLLR